jgi:photosystem II stability/assembly factor-like uncharacterized protein
MIALMPHFLVVRRLCILFFLLLGFAVAALAQPVQLSGVTGGYINSIVRIGGDLYATSGDYSGGDLFRSQDGGDSWQSLGANLPVSTIVTSVGRANGWLLAGTRAGLFLSSDEGQHWQAADPSLPYGTIDAMLADDSELVVSDWTNGVFTASSATGKWTRRLDLKKQVHAIVRTHDKTYIATQGEGVYESDDNNASWRMVSSGLVGDAIYVMSLIEFRDTLYAGTIAGMHKLVGDTWMDAEGPPTQSIVAFATIGDLLFANNWSSEIYMRRAGGPWTRASHGLPEFAESRGLAALNGHLFVASARMGVYRADTSTREWSLHSKGVTNLSIARVISYPAKAGGYSLIAGGDDADFGLAWISHDHGDSWMPALNLTNRGFHDFAWSSGKLFAASDGEGIFASTDDGSTWATSTTATTYPTSLCVTHHALLTGTSGFSLGVLRSLDNGNTWASAMSNIAEANVDVLGFDERSGRAFAGTGGVNCYRSSDDGDNWQLADGGPSALQGLVRSGPNLIAADRAGIFLSSNDGDSWAIVNAKIKNVTSVEHVGGVVLAASQNRLYMTFDDGATWTMFDTLPTSVMISSIATDGQFVYLGTKDYGMWRTSMPRARVKSNAAFTPITIEVTANVLRVHSSQTTIASVRVSDEAGRNVTEVTGSHDGWVEIPRSELPGKRVLFLNCRADGHDCFLKVMMP